MHKSSELFAESIDVEQDKKPHVVREPWNVLIVDDEEQVHSITKLVLDRYLFEGRKLRFYHAYSAKDAREILSTHDDIALVLLDVVMESDQAGLLLAKYIRQELNNKFTRIVLRTGQPGQAPEESVIADYDINDYKDKTELTATKLKTLMYSTLRSYRDIVALEENRRGLEMIIDSSAKIFEKQSLQKFTSAVLVQLIALLGLNKDSAYMQPISGFAVENLNNDYKILSATGKYKDLVDQSVRANLPIEICQNLDETHRQKENFYGEEYYIFYFMTGLGKENLLYISHTQFRPLEEVDKKLLEIFSNNAGIAFENAYLKEEREATQEEIVYLLGDAVETRSPETGNHVKRVAEISELLALAMGVNEKKAARIKSASPLHDLGKIAIPDAILNKNGKLTADEWKIMKTHAVVGYKMLSDSKHETLQYAAIIAHEHHERWDGNGYPRQLAGKQIHLYGRIAAVADVFDALNAVRCYKPAWPMAKIEAYFMEESGKHFDPEIVDVLFENIVEIKRICERLTDV
jgi:response regulator RpfG family c-di-GMP phosphodiesterase